MLLSQLFLSFKLRSCLVQVLCFSAKYVNILEYALIVSCRAADSLKDEEVVAGAFSNF